MSAEGAFTAWFVLSARIPEFNTLRGQNLYRTDRQEIAVLMGYDLQSKSRRVPSCEGG